MLAYFTLLISLLFVYAEDAEVASPYSLCEGRSFISQIKSIKVSGCEGRSRCILRRGQDIVVTVEMRTTERIKGPERFVSGIFPPDEKGKSIELEFGRSSSACPNLREISEVTCRDEWIPKGQDLTFNYKVPVLKEFPSLNLTTRIVMRENGGKNLKKSQKLNWLKHPGRVVFCSLIQVELL